MKPPTQVLLGLVLITLGCRAPPPSATVPYRNDFAAALGPEWTSKNRRWQTVDGQLFDDGAHNVPLWLDAALPDDVRISFAARSLAAAVDIKCELFGDGIEHASGYVVILAGWNNSKSIIARLDEHGPVRTVEHTTRLKAEVAADKVAAGRAHAQARETIERQHSGSMGQTYRFRVERQGEQLRFFVDDVLHLEYFDPSPLRGAGHDRFAFNNWASVVYFDDLLIEPL